MQLRTRWVPGFECSVTPKGRPRLFEEVEKATRQAGLQIVPILAWKRY
jgi:hypothetical protein